MLGLPLGGYNRGVVIPLKCSCPPGCFCRTTWPKTWHLKQCGDPAFINEYGDIFCKNFNSCNGFFIQHAQFLCEVAARYQTYKQQKSFSQFAMALALGMQSAELNLSGHELVKFITTINQEAQKRWTY